jgi:hypothetical protein
MPWGTSIATIDTEAPIVSGDLVHVLTRVQATGEVHGIVKQLEMTRDGRWWLLCLEGAVPLGGYYVPAAIEKIVHRYELRAASNSHARDAGHPAADKATLRFWDEQSLDARAEWTAMGKPRGVPFPGLEQALRIGGTCWPEEFRLPANYDHFRGCVR